MKIEWEGISLMSVILGLIGSMLGVAYNEQEMTKKQVMAALIAGAMCAALFPILAESLIFRLVNWTIPAIGLHVLAFFFGIGGMFIVPGILLWWRTSSKNPFAVIDWMRGRAHAPAPIEPPRKEPLQ